jgi:phage protein D
MPLPNIILGLYIGKSEIKKAERKLLEMLQRVEVKQSDDGAYQGFQITFAGQRPPGRSTDYALLKDPILAPGNRVVITITIAAQPRVLMDGIITHQQAPISHGNGEVSLVVTGKDISLLMDLEDKNKSYKDMKHKEVVEQILKEYARLGVSAKVEPPKAKWPLYPPKQMPAQMGVTDRAYLSALASANGFRFYLLPGPTPGKSVAYWGPPLRQGSQQSALTVNMGTKTNVEKIDFAFDAQAAATVSNALADPNGEKSQETEVTKSTRKPALASQDPFAGNRPLLRKIWLGYAGPDANEAKARAQAMTDQSIDQAATATGTLDTLRYGGLLTAPGMVAVRGAGGAYDGEYTIQSVKHRISIAEYKQDFTLRREGMGTTVQTVKP